MISKATYSLICFGLLCLIVAIVALFPQVAVAEFGVKIMYSIGCMATATCGGTLAYLTVSTAEKTLQKRLADY